MRNEKSKSMQQRWNDLQPSKTMLFWSCAGSVVAALVVGFTWGGWVTGGTARSMSEAAGDQSRYELASVICVERFLAAPDAAAQLAQLKTIDSSFRQRQFIEEGGWATMPSKDSAARQAADLCARVLANLEMETPDAGAEMAPEPASVVR
jgi:isocitrate lyase